MLFSPHAAETSDLKWSLFYLDGDYNKLMYLNAVILDANQELAETLQDINGRKDFTQDLVDRVQATEVRLLKQNSIIVTNSIST